MLGELRRQSKSAIIYFLFAIIIIVFVFTFNTGGQTGGCGGTPVPVYAEVGDHKIDQSTIFMGMRLLPGLVSSQEGMALMMGMGVDIMSLYAMDPENLTPAQGKAIMAALQGLYIISDEAERLGFSVSDKELAKALYPAQFYDENEDSDSEGESGKKVFNWKDYNAWVSYWLRASQSQYEGYTRRVLLAKKMFVYFSGLVQVTDADAEAAGLAKKLQVNLEVAELTAASFTEQVEVPGDLTAFIEEHQEAVDEYYDAHPAEFHSKRLLQIRIALASALPPGPPPRDPKAPKPVADFDKAKVKGDELLARLNGDKPLLPEAPDAKPDPSREPATEDPKKTGAEAPPTGEPATVEPTDPEVRFRELAKNWSDDPESRDRSGTVIGWQKADALGLGPYGPDVAAALAEAKEGDVVGPVKGEAGFWLIRVEGVKAARNLSLEDARPEIAANLYRQENATLVAKAKAEAFLAAARTAKDQSLEQVLAGDAFKGQGIAHRKTGLFPATTPRFSIPTVGPLEDLFSDAFRLTLTAPVADKVFEDERTQRFFIVRLLERETPPTDEPLADADLEAARESMAVERDVAFFQAWYDSLLRRARDDGDIEYTEDYDNYLQFLQANLDSQEAQAAKQAARKARRNR